MGIHLVHNDYGKSRVRLMRVVRNGNQHEVRELTLAIRFEGDFESAHITGDNSKILPTDTMKNTVYALAQQKPIESVEEFCRRLIEHFLGNNPQVSQVEIDASEDLWTRMHVGGSTHGSAFTRVGEEKRTAMLKGTRGGTTVRAGILDLVVLKTTKSAFEGFIKDRYTTLPETNDRLLSTKVVASWLYEDRNAQIDYNRTWEGARQTLLEVFADHNSLSLQQTLYAMGEGVLKKFSAIREIRLSLPNRHYLNFNVAPFGMENTSEVFLPTDEPHGTIEGTIRRD
jgi:urate oxidase